ncbi:hypothetical protein JZ751_011666 [Albula glossodonta]|uniref:Scavenger receptor class B member 1 n=1 Tax=Albula glossodonta TaxID=121402 RepID=A0A8T2PQF5_9TELE|nr:hypothetical protein JZ751_011666 [Albula glossodonta]
MAAEGCRPSHLAITTAPSPPSAHLEYRQKDNITFHANKTVSYREYRQYHFMRNMSVGNESDVVTIPNMLVLGAAVMMENMPYAVRLLVSTTFKTFNEGPFLTKPVGELMWGYDSKLVDFLNTYLPGMLPSSGKFGLFAEFNNSNTGLFTVFTGEGDIRNVHKVDSWNGLKEVRPQSFLSGTTCGLGCPGPRLLLWSMSRGRSGVNYWRTEQCNMINGTAGQMWPPFMTPESTLPFYSPDACRYPMLPYPSTAPMPAGTPCYPTLLQPRCLQVPHVTLPFYSPDACRYPMLPYPSTAPMPAGTPCYPTLLQPRCLQVPHVTLPFYSPDACRSMELVYQRPGEVAGIPIFRYIAPTTLSAVLGLDPNEHDHGLFIDIHPVRSPTRHPA